MTVIQFNILPSFKQLSLLWSKGVYLAKRIENNFSVMLYQMQSFYVEVYYDEAETEVERIYTFNNTKDLEPYLPEIALPV